VSYWQGLLDAHSSTVANLIAQFAAAPEFTSRLRAFFGQP